VLGSGCQVSGSGLYLSQFPREPLEHSAYFRSLLQRPIKILLGDERKPVGHDEVRFKLVAPSTSWFRRRRSVFAEGGGFELGFSPGGFAADLISAIEARALWSRFGF